MKEHRFQPIRKSKFTWRDRETIYGASRIAIGSGSGRPAREYLYAKRDLDVGTVAAFRLGFVPFSGPMRWEWECLRGRVVIPVFDVYDKLIALSMRPVGNCDEQKYWNESYPKGEHLFGLNIAKYGVAAHDFAVVTEGQFDVMKMHSHGISNAVGMLGGAFTPIHAHLLMRWTKNIVFVLDSDAGGDKHAERIREVLGIFSDSVPGSKKKRDFLSRSNKLDSLFVRLPDDMDPADYLSAYGGHRLKDLISKAASAEGKNFGWQ